MRKPGTERADAVDGRGYRRLPVAPGSADLPRASVVEPSGRRADARKQAMIGLSFTDLKQLQMRLERSLALLHSLSETLCCSQISFRWRISCISGRLVSGLG